MEVLMADWIMCLIGAILVFDGIVSIILQLDDDWWYQPGRVLRAVLGVYLCLVGADLMHYTLFLG